MTAIIAYENLMESASSVTATSEATGYEVENCFDWLTHDYWQATAAGTNYVTVDLGSAKSVDYWAVFAHDLQDNAGGVRVQYSSDNFSSDVNEYGGNLLTYSEQFDNGAWSLGGTPVVTQNTANAPNGERTADTIEDDNNAAWEALAGGGALPNTAGTYTASVYIKKDTIGRATRFPGLRIEFSGSTSETADVMLDTATGESQSTDTSPNPVTTAVSECGDYWRISVTATNDDASNTSVSVYLYPAMGASAGWAQSSSAMGSITAWGIHLSESSAAEPYHPHPAKGLIFYPGSEVSARYWRFRFADSTTASKIGVLALGKRLDLPVGMRVGFTPPHHGRRFEYLPQLSDSGRFIGRSIRRSGYETEISLQHVEASWARQYLQHFLAHADSKPFFFCWDSATYTWEGAYCWLTDNVQPSYSTPTRMDVRLSVGCLV